MNRTGSILIFLAAFLNMMACSKEQPEILVRPSGTVSTLEHQFSGFTRIETGTAFRLEITITQEVAPVRISADDNLHNHILVERSSDILIIRLMDNVVLDGPATLRGYVSAPMLYGIAGSGASGIDVFGILDKPEQPLNISLSGGSFLGSEVNADQLTLSLSGASHAILTGQVGRMDATASGGSLIEDFELQVTGFYGDLSGGSVARLTIHDAISLTASGASTLYYRGDAIIVRSDLSGGSSLIRDR